MHTLRVLAIISIIISLIACDSKERVKAPKEHSDATEALEAHSGSHKIVVEEVIDAKAYTYVRATEDGEEIWLATTKQPIKAGMTLYYENAMPMQNFNVKELDRTFDELLFVGLLKGETGTLKATAGQASPYSASNIQRESDISVAKIEGGVTIAELLADPKAYEGKMVSVRGKVTKYNPNILGKNWVHLQDGTSHNNRFDLTLTTVEKVKLGDEVDFRGTIVLNKDFGAGYTYDILLEEATLSVES